MFVTYQVVNNNNYPTQKVMLLGIGETELFILLLTLSCIKLCFMTINDRFECTYICICITKNLMGSLVHIFRQGVIHIVWTKVPL